MERSNDAKAAMKPAFFWRLLCEGAVLSASVETRLDSPSTRQNNHRRLMADIANKYPENVTGKFYVDNQCIDCDLCRETAPSNFTRNEDGGYSYVYKQPESPEEEALCKEAKEGCPVEAIGDNGA
jgi:ferredoxin